MVLGFQMYTLHMCNCMQDSALVYVTLASISLFQTGFHHLNPTYHTKIPRALRNTSSTTLHTRPQTIQTIMVLPTRKTRGSIFVPFITLLSTLDRITLPSLQTLSFVNIGPKFKPLNSRIFLKISQSTLRISKPLLYV